MTSQLPRFWSLFLSCKQQKTPPKTGQRPSTLCSVRIARAYNFGKKKFQTNLIPKKLIKIKGWGNLEDSLDIIYTPEQGSIRTPE